MSFTAIFVISALVIAGAVFFYGRKTGKESTENDHMEVEKRTAELRKRIEAFSLRADRDRLANRVRRPERRKSM